MLFTTIYLIRLGGCGTLVKNSSMRHCDNQLFKSRIENHRLAMIHYFRNASDVTYHFPVPKDTIENQNKSC